MLKVIAILLLHLTGLSAIGWAILQAQQSGQEQWRQQNRQMIERMGASAAAEVRASVQEMYRRLGLFADIYRQEIGTLMAAGEDEAIYQRLVDQVHMHFPDYYAFTLVRPGGDVLFDPFKESIGDLCRADIEESMASREANVISLHPGPGQYHTDFMVNRLLPDGSNGLVFLSLKARSMAEVLSRFEHPDFRLYLLRKSRDYLIEVGSEGERSLLKRSFRLSEEERRDIVYDQAIEGTDWNLVAVSSAAPAPVSGNWDSIFLVLLLYGLFSSGLVVWLLGCREACRQVPAAAAEPVPEPQPVRDEDLATTAGARQADDAAAPLAPAQQQADAESQESVLFDQQVAATLAGKIGKDSCGNIYRALFAGSGDNLMQLEQLLDAADCEGLRRLSHQLKGSSGNLGLMCLHHLYARLEQQALACRAGAAPEQLAQLRELVQEIARQHPPSEQQVQAFFR